jgi:endonuclease-8
MPEGDTIHRLAHRLSAELPGEEVTYAWNRDGGELSRLVGEHVGEIEARGKNLLIEVSGGWMFRIHLGIGGRCRCRDRDDAPPPVRWATLVLDTEAHRTVVWKTSRAELMRTAHVRAARGLRHLGPDLLDDDCDLGEVMRRARAAGNRGRAVGELLQDQRIAAGIGNVIRCEALFLAGVDPWQPTRDLDDARLRACFDHARAILQRSVAVGRRDTTSEMGERYFAYGRTGRPCLRCGTRIRQVRQGDLARVTHHCPTCQRRR